MKKLYICGLQGHGKGLLRALLDGHPSVISSGYFSLPGLSLLKDDFIDYISKSNEILKIDSLYQSYNKNIQVSLKINDKTLVVFPGRILKYIIINSDIDYHAIDYFINHRDSKNNKEYEFNILLYLSKCADELKGNKYDSLESLQEVFYYVFLENFCQSADRKTMNDRYFLQIPFVNGFNSIEQISKKLIDKKILIIDRNPISSAFMNTERLVERDPRIINRNEDLFDRLYFNQYDRILFSKQYVNKYKNFHEKLDSLLEQNEKDIYVVDFDDLILQTENTMDEIAGFLDIEVNPVLYKATINGVPINHLSEGFQTGKIMHDPYKLLSKKQIHMLNYLFNGWDSNLSLLQNFFLFINKIKLNIGSNKYFIWFVLLAINFLRLFKKNRII